jgi:hypothetical protein
MGHPGRTFGRTRALLGVFGMVLVACGPDGASVEPTQVAASGQTVEAARPQVVALRSEAPSGSWVFCSGTYVAPRVVLTAAHCVPSDPGSRILVYHGNDWVRDYAALEEVPRPGAPSPWATADSWRTHPDWDPTIMYPDLAVVYLDRELPFDPLPIAPWRLEEPDIGRTGEIVAYGVPGPVGADEHPRAGDYVKHSGPAPFSGSPPGSPKPPDPHPGLDIPEVRAGLALFNGVDAGLTACASESRGPFIMKQGQREYTFGVASWTVDWCDGFSYHTRIDPFVGFLEEQIARAGGAPVSVTPLCVTEQPSGRLRAHIGYDNQNGISLDIPHGPFNHLPQDKLGVRPTRFKPGKASFAVDLGAGATLTYRLDGQVGPVSTLRMGAGSPRCSIEHVSSLFCRTTSSLRCATFDECVAFTADTSWMPADCTGLYVDWVRCAAWLTVDNYSCINGMPYVVSDACSRESSALLACVGS